MKPLSVAIDMLQKETGMYLGHLLPILYRLKENWKKFQTENNIQYCLPLVKCLLESLEKRLVNSKF